MADKAKKYYWLKLKEDFFDDDTISFIEEQENGVYYVNFYLKLCLKSLKADGRLIRLIGENLIPYDAKSLARLTNTPVDTVRVAMELFKQIGLVKVFETGEIYLSQMNEMIGSETDKAAIMRRKRAEQKVSGNTGVTLLPECYTEIEKELEQDIREKESPNPQKGECANETKDIKDLLKEFLPDNIQPKEPETIKPKATTPIQQKENKLDFDSWYSHYPKKVSRGNAEKAWKKIKPDQATIQHMIKACDYMLSSGQWTDNRHDEKYQFIPYPASWLNSKGWLDENAQPPKSYTYEVEDTNSESIEETATRSSIKIKVIEND